MSKKQTPIIEELERSPVIIGRVTDLVTLPLKKGDLSNVGSIVFYVFQKNM